MRRAPSRLVIVCMGVALALGACSGGGDSSSKRRDVPRSAPKTTTAALPRIDLSQPIPGGSLHGTPRPPLENTGDDYVAIFESLVANLRWVSENPDPTLISELYVPGTPAHDARVEAYQFLVDNDYHWADEGYFVVSTDVVDARPQVVSLRVVDQLEYERLLDLAGNQVGDVRTHGTPETSNVLLADDGEGRWRIASWDRANDSTVAI